MVSETKTENIFRNFYGTKTFIEKSAISNEYGFKSKKNPDYKGYPDFFMELTNYCIVVEAKAEKQTDAINEVKYYMHNNKISKDLIGIAVSGQTEKLLKVSYFIKTKDMVEIEKLNLPSKLFDLKIIDKSFIKAKYGESVSSGELVKILNDLNKKFNNNNKVPETERSLFFSGIMIALKDTTFRNTYKNITAPTPEEVSTTKASVLESHNLNRAILDAIEAQLRYKINNMSKEYSWRDKFSFIKNIDYTLLEYKEIINKIEKSIFEPFQNEEKFDILGRAYKIFLSRAGKIDNKNIILTPDHIKSLMVKLARLTPDDVVLDTCTGSGGFLMESMEYMINQCKNDENKIKRIKENQLIGFEIDPTLFALACSNMFLHGDGRTNLLYRSSLINEDSSNIVNNKDEELFNYIKSFKPTKVIINPPYENNNSIKFAQQAIDYLENNGKLVIIMPTPTLSQNKDNLTKKLLSEAKLDFVIKMPFKLFSEQKRTVNTSIFGFTKTPHREDDEVLFYNLRNDGFVSVQHRGKIDKNYSGWETVENEIVNTVVNRKEKENISQMKKIYNHNELYCYGIPIKRTSKFELISLDTIFTMEDGSLASEKAEDGEYAFITASDETKTNCFYDNEGEAIVMAVSAAGSLGKTHYINEKFIASNLCVVFKNKYNKKYPINLKFYNYYFKTIRDSIIDDLADGTSKLTIDKVNLYKNYYIEYIPIDVQNKFVKDYLEPFEILQQSLLKQDLEIKQSIKDIIK